MRRSLLVIAALAGVLVLLSLRAPARAEAPSAITIGAKNFPESRILAEIMAQLIEDRTELSVERRANLGGTMVVFSALRTGQIDLYPEYTGTAWTVHLRRNERVADRLQVYAIVRDVFEERYDLTWLHPLGFENNYAIAMDERRAEELGVTKISDLVPLGAKLRAGVSHEFLNRPDGFEGLAATYGLEVGDLRGMEHGLAYQAIGEGKIDFIDSYTTDGKLLRYDLRLLEDDAGFFPPYDAAPVVRQAVLQAHPELEGVINELGFRIDEETMQRLNAAVEEEKRSFEDVAREFLRDEGLVGEGAQPGSTTDRRQGFFAFMWDQRGHTLALTQQHLTLTLIAELLAILFAVPLGVALTRQPRLAGPVIGATGVLQTIPSLALLAFIFPIPGLGLGARSAIVALFLYALLPIVRNTYAGITEVDADLLEAARGMGLRDAQILRLVELPLATRTIMAGIRTSTVIGVGVATLAAFIGAGGLGDPIVTGLQLNDTQLILSGAVPAAALAVVVDAGLGVIERALTPRGLRR